MDSLNEEIVHSFETKESNIEKIENDEDEQCSSGSEEISPKALLCPMDEEETLLSYKDYLENARKLFFQECCLSTEQLRAYDTSMPFIMVYLRTYGDDDIIGNYNEYKPIRKSVFMTNRGFKNQVIKHYQSLGFRWIDIVCLQRSIWTLFLWKAPVPN